MENLVYSAQYHRLSVRWIYTAKNKKLNYHVWTELNCIKAVDSEKYSECDVATETVEHFVLDCPNSELHVCDIIRATCKSLGIEPKIEITLSHERIDRSIKRKL